MLFKPFKQFFLFSGRKLLDCSFHFLDILTHRSPRKTVLILGNDIRWAVQRASRLPEVKSKAVMAKGGKREVRGRRSGVEGRRAEGSRQEADGRTKCKVRSAKEKGREELRIAEFLKR